MKERISVRIDLPRPGFYGAMNISGNGLAWSFTDKTWPASSAGMERVVRYVGAQGSERRSFWVSFVSSERSAGLSATCNVLDQVASFN